MKITLLPSSFSADSSQNLTSYLVNDSIAIDAGSLGLYQTPAEQAAVRHVFVSHTHLDHWATLPVFLINVFAMGAGPVTLHASEIVLDCLKQDVFNGRVWPKFLEMTDEGRRFVNVNPIAAGQTIDVDGVRVTLVAVDHAVPTLGFLLEDATAAVVIPSDTAATTEIWQRAERMPNLKAVFLEATLPNDLASLAAITKHLTPAGFVREMQKLSRPVPFFAVHLSARARDQVRAELLALQMPNLQIAEIGKTYEF